jgi:hypothetical protein
MTEQEENLAIAKTRYPPGTIVRVENIIFSLSEEFRKNYYITKGEFQCLKDGRILAPCTDGEKNMTCAVFIPHENAEQWASIIPTSTVVINSFPIY